MIFTLKDLLYFSIFAASIATIWTTFKSRMRSVEKSDSLNKKIIFEDSGELRLVTKRECAERKRTAVDAAVALQKKVEDMGDNIIRIMVHMDIKNRRSDNNAEHK